MRSVHFFFVSQEKLKKKTAAATFLITIYIFKKDFCKVLLFSHGATQIILSFFELLYFVICNPLCVLCFPSKSIMINSLEAAFLIPTCSFKEDFFKMLLISHEVTQIILSILSFSAFWYAIGSCLQLLSWYQFIGYKKGFFKCSSFSMEYINCFVMCNLFMFFKSNYNDKQQKFLFNTNW